MSQKNDAGARGGGGNLAPLLPENVEYEIYRKDKFSFRIPKNAGFFFDENGCWAYISGDKALIGVADLVLQSLYEIIFFSPPKVDAEIQQFGELGIIESGKAVFAVISPVTGKVTAVNEALAASPELINQDPYEKGWIAEVKLADFEKDRKRLLDFKGYFPILKQKVAEFPGK